MFQCESDGAQRTLRKLKARTVADLAMANAFFKPGPAMGGMASAFVRRYRGEEPVAYLHPALRPILGPTKGVLIFQEQILRLAREIAGLSWAQADQLRRGMSHFGADQMDAIREQFVAGCMRPPPDGPGFTLSQAKTLWEQVMPFAGYGFNQGHATAYADVSFRSAYLKAHYPGRVPPRAPGRLRRLPPSRDLHGRGGAAGHRRPASARELQRGGVYAGRISEAAESENQRIGGYDQRRTCFAPRSDVPFASRHPLHGPGTGARSAADRGRAIVAGRQRKRIHRAARSA